MSGPDEESGYNYEGEKKKLHDKVAIMNEAVGQTLRDFYPDNVGFVVFAFDYTDDPEGEHGFMTYLSSAQREQAIAAVEETLEKLKEGEMDE